MDSVYFGGVECHLQAAEGSVFVFRDEDFAVDRSPEARATALRRRQPFACTTAPPHHPEEAESELVVVAVPRTDLLVRTSPAADADLASLPRVLAQPLIKSKDGPIAGLASGVRSGLVKDGDSFIRLKGCGNHDQGFTMRTMQSEHGEVLRSSGSGKSLCEIRGCAYPYTAHIEQHMSARIDSLLSRVGMQCGNKPLGWFEYSTPTLPFTDIKRSCGIFRTLGDRRLSDHVLHGIEVLLPALFASPPEVLAHFPEGPFGPRAADGGVFQEMDETHMLFACGGSDMPHVFADLGDVSLPGFRPPSPVPLDAREGSPSSLPSPSSSAGEFGFPPDAPASLRPVWNESCHDLSEFCRATPDEAGKLLGYIYRRLGRECGIVSRTLANAGICWGTFRDLSGTHCNAHGNNMVLVAPEAGEGASPQRPFLAPVDFDFAYTAEEAVLGENAEEDLSKAEENIAFEMRALAMDLGLYPASTGTKNNHTVPPAFQALRWGLRDTMVRSFIASSHDGTVGIATSQEDPGTWLAAHHLLRLALIKTWNVIA